jgi:hypothetical protein
VRRGTASGRAVVGGVALAFVMVAGSREARAEPGEEVARRTFEEAIALEKKGAYADALLKFRESSAIKATLGNRYHVAYCLEMTGKLAAALSEYEAIDQAARDQQKKDVIEATRLRMEPLRTRVPTLAIRVAKGAPAELVVKLDDEPISPVLLDGRTFRAEAGHHALTAHAPEHEDLTRALDLAEGSSTTVDVDLPPTAKPPGVTTKTDGPTTERDRPSRFFAILATGGAAAFAVGGIAAFVAAGSAQDDGRSSCLAKVSCKSEQSQVRSLDTLALTGLIGAAALGAVAIVLWTSSPPRTAGTRTRASLVGHGPWVGVEGRWE